MPRRRPRFDDALGQTIIDKLMSKLDDPAVVKGFGVVAADPRPCGVAVYERLVSLADSGDVGAIEALAETNTAKAGEVVAELASQGVPAAQDALLRMGDLAVATLAQRANQVWAVDGLAKIATPAAIERLLPVMADDSMLTRHRVAWHLAVLLRRRQCAQCRTGRPPASSAGSGSPSGPRTTATCPASSPTSPTG